MQTDAVPSVTRDSFLIGMTTLINLAVGVGILLWNRARTNKREDAADFVKGHVELSERWKAIAEKSTDDVKRLTEALTAMTLKCGALENKVANLEEDLADERKRAPAGGGRRVAKLLLVDDDRDTLRYAAELLRSEGYEVGVATNGANAIAKLGEEHFDLMVLDMDMPVMTGRQVLEKVGPMAPPIIVMAAGGERAADFAGTKVARVIPKPHVGGEGGLLDAIAEVLAAYPPPQPEGLAP